MYLQIGAISSSGVSPIVRVPASEPWMFKRVLDAGAHGIMVPMCETKVRSQHTLGRYSFNAKNFISLNLSFVSLGTSRSDRQGMQISLPRMAKRCPRRRRDVCTSSFQPERPRLSIECQHQRHDMCANRESNSGRERRSHCQRGRNWFVAHV